MKRLINLLLTTLIFTACNPNTAIRQMKVYGENTAPKPYIVDEFRLKNWERGVFDINRNDKVDPGVDYFFFAEKGTWWLHNIYEWNDTGKEIDFSISQYPIKARIDTDSDGYPDITYVLKPDSKIQHQGYIDLFNQSQRYINGQNKKI